MILPFGHDARMPGKQDALAVVEPAPLVLSHDSGVAVSLAVPNDPVRLSAVEVIGTRVNAAKVRYAVIKSIVIDVVDYVGLFAVIEKPREAVRKIAAAINVDAEVFTGARQRAGNVASFPGPVAGKPGQSARFRVVGENVADRIWYKFCSHLKSPLDLVRGLTAATVSAPILTRESNNGR